MYFYAAQLQKGANLKKSKLEDIYIKCKNQIERKENKAIRFVYGSGNEEAKLVLVGEAPGKQEVLQGKPFVGQAGKNLDEFLEILDIKREQIYITNVVKYRPIKVDPSTGRESNRTPDKEEIESFRNFLMEELSIIEPKLIVSLGNIALRTILGDKAASIGDYHGRPTDILIDNRENILFPLYHPASIIYRRELKETYIQDLHKLKAYIAENNIII